MGNRRIRTAAAMLIAIGLLLCGPLRAQNAGKTGPAWTPPKKAWGHPDIEGLYTNKDEANTPLERPDGLKGRSVEDFSAAELESLAKARQELAAKIAGGIGGAETGAGPTLLGRTSERQRQPSVADHRSTRRKAAGPDAASAEA